MNKQSSKTNTQQDTSPAQILQGLWFGTCARYTVLCLALLTISAILSDSATVTYIEPVRFFLLLPFGFFVTLAARVRNGEKLPTGAKLALHPILVLGGFYLCCYLPFQITSKPAAQQVFLFLLLAVLLYGLFMGIFLLILRCIKRKKMEDTPYVSQYSRGGSK